MIWAVDRVDDRSGPGLTLSLLKSIQQGVNISSEPSCCGERRPQWKEWYPINDRAKALVAFLVDGLSRPRTPWIVRSLFEVDDGRSLQPRII